MIDRGLRTWVADKLDHADRHPEGYQYLPVEMTIDEAAQIRQAAARLGMDVEEFMLASVIIAMGA